MSKCGEPWTFESVGRHNKPVLRDRDGYEGAQLYRWTRIVSCVNALADRDPEKLDALIEAAKEMVNSGKESTDPQDWINASDRLEAALAAFEDGK